MAILLVAGLAQDDSRRAECAEWRTDKHSIYSPGVGVSPSSWFTAIEGGAPSSYAAEQMRKFVACEITVEEMRDRVVTNASRPTV